MIMPALALAPSPPPRQALDIEATIAALDRSQLILELAPNGEILRANENFLATFGYELDEIVGHHHALLISAEEAQRADYIAFWDRLRAGEFFTDTFHRRAKDGSDVWIQGVYNPVLDTNGRPYKIIKVATDVTAIERERRAAIALNASALDQAQHALAAKARFLANVSHELRTPLAAMLGLGDLLSKTSLDAEQASILSDIMSSGEVLQSLVNDLLCTAQLEAGAVEIHLEPVNATSIAVAVQSLLTPRARDKGLRLDLYADDLPPALLLDGLRVRQVLTNLVNNAIKFTAEGAVTVRLDWRDETLFGAVTDTGEGFPPEEAARLFQPFEQRRETREQSAGGVGLGLAICADLITAMGGTINAESAPGFGASFRFSIPAKVGKIDERQSTTGELKTRRRPLNALVAEDNSALQRIMIALLGTLGCQVSLAANGLEAVNLYQQHPADHFDICFMDLRMPIMDGVEAMRAIRALGRPGHLPIVAVSADVLDGQGMIAGISGFEGFDGFASKPISPDAIAAYLDAVALGAKRRG
jgi:PAS domain S-box-containing protein